jgi:fructose-bisphosphate aldolase class I
MISTDLDQTAQSLVAPGKGLLAVDEAIPTLTRRFAALSIESTPDMRRAYREMFFTTPGISAFISGVIMHDETIRQKAPTGTRLVDLLTQQGLIAGIKVDRGVTPLTGCPGEFVTEGLDGLRQRLQEYRGLGARFAKWRAVFVLSDSLPRRRCTQANASALARCAAICQEQGFIPVLEPDALTDGSHSLERCETVTGEVLRALFDALDDEHVSLEGLLLKVNMVTAGRTAIRHATVREVGTATVRCLRRHVPPAVPGIAFLSGGQHPLVAAAHLSAINQVTGTKPWKLTFSFGRALQDEALQAWHGRPENVGAGQRAFYRRARCNSAAALGDYSPSLERESAVALS